MTKAEMTGASGRWVWLSHPLDETTPAYGGGPGMKIKADKCIAQGDACNTATISLPNHLGSHVDAPRHFIAEGRSITDYAPEDWMFQRPLLADLPAGDSELLTARRLESALADVPDGIPIEKTDLLLIRTGFGRYRGEKRFWEAGPGLSHESAVWICRRFPCLTAVGVDAISISCRQHRAEGRRAHRTLLGNGLRIFEDLALNNLKEGEILNKVTALPLPLQGGDGAPCAAFGITQ